jgi:hypothetical protein
MTRLELLGDVLWAFDMTGWSFKGPTRLAVQRVCSHSSIQCCLWGRRGIDGTPGCILREVARVRSMVAQRCIGDRLRDAAPGIQFAVETK